MPRNNPALQPRVTTYDTWAKLVHYITLSDAADGTLQSRCCREQTVKPVSPPPLPHKVDLVHLGGR